jgi:hypothetical protein
MLTMDKDKYWKRSTLRKHFLKLWNTKLGRGTCPKYKGNAPWCPFLMTHWDEEPKCALFRRLFYCDYKPKRYPRIPRPRFKKIRRKK